MMLATTAHLKKLCGVESRSLSPLGRGVNLTTVNVNFQCSGHRLRLVEIECLCLDTEALPQNRTVRNVVQVQYCISTILGIWVSGYPSSKM